MFCDCSIPRTAGKAPIWDMALAVGEGDRFARRGAEVFARNCAGCHGPEGRGDGPAAVALTPAPRNLTIARFSDRRLSESLWNGVRGSSMPPWNDLTAGDLRGLIAFLGTIAPSDPTPSSKRKSGRRPEDSSPSSAPSATARMVVGTGHRRRSWPRARRTSTKSGPRRPTPSRPWPTGSGARRCPAGQASSPRTSRSSWPATSGPSSARSEIRDHQRDRRRRDGARGRIRRRLARLPPMSPLDRGPQVATARLGPAAPKRSCWRSAGGLRPGESGSEGSRESPGRGRPSEWRTAASARPNPSRIPLASVAPKTYWPRNEIISQPRRGDRQDKVLTPDGRPSGTTKAFRLPWESSSLGFLKAACPWRGRGRSLV